MCRRCCVPLRVPVCTLTDATLWFILCFSNCIKGCCLALQLQDYRVAPPPTNKIVFCEVPNRRSGAIKLLHTLRMSNLIRSKVGFADHRAHPDRTSSASQGARMLLLLLQAFLCVLYLFSMSKFNFCEQAGVEPAPPGEKH